jgi:hypothetical protein
MKPQVDKLKIEWKKSSTFGRIRYNVNLINKYGKLLNIKIISVPHKLDNAILFTFERKSLISYSKYLKVKIDLYFLLEKTSDYEGFMIKAVPKYASKGNKRYTEFEIIWYDKDGRIFAK